VSDKPSVLLPSTDLLTPVTDNPASEQLKAIAEAVFGNDRMNLRGVLTRPQLAQLARGIIYAEYFDSGLMRTLITTLLECTVSVNGRGRLDLVKFAQAMRPMGEDMLPQGRLGALKMRLLGH